MSTQVILLERVEKLGKMGEVVSVKPGFARNYLLPQKKALRANKENIAYFEAQKKSLEAANEKGRISAEKQAKDLEGLTVSIIRQSSESGQLFGSVTARDIAVAILDAAKSSGVERSMVAVNQNFKTLGLFPIAINLHPEVQVAVTINIARSDEEATIQLETGRAVTDTVTNVEEDVAEEPLIDEENLSAALEDDALEAEKVRAEEKAVTDAETAAKSAAKSEERAAKNAAKAEAAADAAEDEEGEAVEMGATEAPAEDADKDAE